MGSVIVADANPTHPCQLIVPAASFVFGRRPAVHLAEQIHQGKGPLDARSRVEWRLAAFRELLGLNSLPPRYHSAYVFRVHRTRVYRPETVVESPSAHAQPEASRCRPPSGVTLFSAIFGRDVETVNPAPITS
jgi:hypothetical protein